jgi:hypothetical protein
VPEPAVLEPPAVPMGGAPPAPLPAVPLSAPAVLFPLPAAPGPVPALPGPEPAVVLTLPAAAGPDPAIGPAPAPAGVVVPLSEPQAPRATISPKLEIETNPKLEIESLVMAKNLSVRARTIEATGQRLSRLSWRWSVAVKVPPVTEIGGDKESLQQIILRGVARP